MVPWKKCVINRRNSMISRILILCFIASVVPLRLHAETIPVYSLFVSLEYHEKTGRLSSRAPVRLMQSEAPLRLYQPEEGFLLGLLSTKGKELYATRFDVPQTFDGPVPETPTPFSLIVPYLGSSASVEIRNPKNDIALTLPIAPENELVNSYIALQQERAQQQRQILAEQESPKTQTPTAPSPQSTQNQEVQNKNSATITALIVVVLGLGVTLLFVAIFLAMRKK